MDQIRRADQAVKSVKGKGWLTSRSRVGTDRSANGTIATGWLSPDDLFGA